MIFAETGGNGVQSDWYEKVLFAKLDIVMMMHQAEYVKTYCKVRFGTLSIAMLWAAPELPPLIGCGLLLLCCAASGLVLAAMDHDSPTHSYCQPRLRPLHCVG